MAATKGRSRPSTRAAGRPPKSKTGDPACSAAMRTWKTSGMTPGVAQVLGKCRAMAHQKKTGVNAGNPAVTAQMRRGGDREQRLNRLIVRQQDQHERYAKAGIKDERYYHALDRAIALKRTAEYGHPHPPDRPAARLKEFHQKVQEGRKQLADVPTPSRVERGSAKRQKQAKRLRASRKIERDGGIDPADNTKHGPGQSGDVNTDLIHFDPSRFQYKIHQTDTRTGAVGSLAGVKRWNPELGGMIQVWKDPKDQKTYVVNGHNRLDLARKLGIGKISARYLDAKDHQEARAKGALTNIAEGRGTAVDAAKFFRDSGIQKADLESRGIPLTEAKADQGLALAGLSNPLFRRVVDETMPVERAAIIGGSGLSHSRQAKVADLVDGLEKKKPITNNHLREIIDDEKDSKTVSDSQGGLFGDDPEEKSLALERTKLRSEIKERLGREKRLFGTVSKSKAAEDLARGGNRIDTEQSGQISRDAGEALRVFDTMKRLRGPMSDAIQEASEKLHGAKGRSERKTISDEAYANVLNHIKQAYNL